jgi:hypothetical protein
VLSSDPPLIGFVDASLRGHPFQLSVIDCIKVKRIIHLLCSNDEHHWHLNEKFDFYDV